MSTLDPTFVQLLIAFARQSPDNARLAQTDPQRFVKLALRGRAGDFSSHVSSILASGLVKTTNWTALWLQPSQEP
jgi:hypothetical protein